MSSDPRRGGTPPPPSTRRARREANRRDRRYAAAATAAARPAWQSPMVLVTAAAVLVGIVLVVLLATGVLGQRLPGGGLLTPQSFTPTDLVSASDPRELGKPGVKATLEVWSDYQCPFCRQWTENVMPSFITTYVEPGKAAIAYRDFAFIDGGNPAGESHQAAAATRCAAAQNKFWPYHDWLFVNQQVENSGRFSASLLGQVADKVGLNRAAFDACMADPATVAAVTAETAQGRADGITSTPSLALNGKFLYRTAAGALTYDKTTADGTANTPAGGATMADLAPLMDNLINGTPLPTPVPSASASPGPSASSGPSVSPSAAASASPSSGASASPSSSAGSSASPSPATSAGASPSPSP